MIERAPYGNLASLLAHTSDSLAEQDQIDICWDVTSGLHFLHQNGVVHGDVKPDNVLVFDSAKEGRRYTAKLTDFGSSIIIDQASHAVRYFGTKTTNAPETEDQSGERAIKPDMLPRCDNYSLGLLFLYTLSKGFNELWTRKDPHVLDNAQAYVNTDRYSPDFRATFCQALQFLLQWDAQKRCSSLAIVLDILKPFSLDDLALSGYPKIGRSDHDISKAIEKAFGSEDYLEFGWVDEETIELDPQEQIFATSVKESQSPLQDVAGRAYFELALAYSLGFGATANIDMALNSIVEAAKRDYLPAKAVFYTWYDAHSKECPVDAELQLDWLYDAAVWGSTFANEVLQLKSPSDCIAARKMFHHRGGYNQYFYGSQPPAHIHSEDFIQSLPASGFNNDDEHVNALLQSAAIYGDISLAAHLLYKANANPNLTNQFGESLLLFCCKGGHIDLLEVSRKLFRS